MYTLDELRQIVYELEQIDASVRSRYTLPRAAAEEKTGLSLKDPGVGKTVAERFRRLAFDLCGMQYWALHYNLVLLTDKLNEIPGRELVRGIPTYSAPRGQINFNTENGKVTLDPAVPLTVDEFLDKFGLAGTTTLNRPRRLKRNP